MRLHMIDTDEGLLQLVGERLPKIQTYEQRTYETGAKCRRDAIEFLAANIRTLQRLLNHGHDQPLMSSGGQLGYNASVVLVNELRRDNVRPHASVLDDRSGCFITRCLYTKHSHINKLSKNRPQLQQFPAFRIFDPKNRILSRMFMNHRFVLLLWITVLVPAALQAQEKRFGLGIIIGEPTGISGKLWLSQTNAIDGGIAWSFTKNSSLHLHADYLWHVYDAIESPEIVPLYWGVGGRMKTGNKGDARIGVRFVFGVNYIFKKLPVDIFFELGPIMDVIPETSLRINGGLGGRYFF